MTYEQADARYVRRLAQIERAGAPLLQAAFAARFAGGQGFADWSAMDRVHDRMRRAFDKAGKLAERDYARALEGRRAAA